MAEQGSDFSPQSLLRYGPQGLAALFDRLAPDTAPPLALGAVAESQRRLIEQLGADSFQAREAAADELRALGRAAYAALQAAVKSPDAEISWRAASILRDRHDDVGVDLARYLPALMRILRHVNDPPSLDLLADRTVRLLQSGEFGGGRGLLVRELVHILIDAPAPSYAARLEPLLDATNPRIGLLLVQSAAYATRDRECPAILLRAIESRQKQVAASAIEAMIRYPRSAADSAVRQQLQKVLQGNDESLKLRASRPLIHLFGDAAALDYVLDQARASTNRTRRIEAVRCLANPRISGASIRPEVLNGLTKLTESSDRNLQLLALSVLADYQGEAVVEALIPLAAKPNLTQEVLRRLLLQRDRELVRRKLQEAATGSPDAAVRQQAQRILDNLAPPGATNGARGNASGPALPGAAVTPAGESAAPAGGGGLDAAVEAAQDSDDDPAASEAGN